MIIGEQISDEVWDLRAPLWRDVRGRVGGRVIREANEASRTGLQILWGPIHDEIQEAR